MNVTYKKIIICLIRLKLGLKQGEKFRFVNQKSKGVYWFTDSALIKRVNKQEMLSDVSLNYVLSDECIITKL